MSRPVSALPILGPRSEAAFAKAGAGSAEAVPALGADAAYARLLAAGTRPHFMGFIALALAVQGRPWTDFDPAEKPALRARFDALKAAAGPDAAGRAALEAALARIGVMAPARPTTPGSPAQPTRSRPAKK